MWGQVRLINRKTILLINRASISTYMIYCFKFVFIDAAYTFTKIISTDRVLVSVYLIYSSLQFWYCYLKDKIKKPFILLQYVECPLGKFGMNCLVTCPPLYYGRLCKNQCDCSFHRCNMKYGCKTTSKIKTPIIKKIVILQIYFI